MYFFGSRAMQQYADEQDTDTKINQSHLTGVGLVGKCTSTAVHFLVV